MLVIEINNLEVFTNIGVAEAEREKSQKLHIRVMLSYSITLSWSKALINNDDIKDVICYNTLCQKIRDFSQEQEFKLLEAFTLSLYRSIEDFCCKIINNISLKLEVTKFPVIDGLRDGVTCKIDSYEAFE